jgi:hypothetical protein
VTIDTQTGTQTSAIDAQADRLVQHTRQTAASATPGEQNDAKIIKAGKDFESILLGICAPQRMRSRSMPGLPQPPSSLCRPAPEGAGPPFRLNDFLPSADNRTDLDGGAM